MLKMLAEITLLIPLLVLYLTPSVIASSHYGRAQKVKHYAAGGSTSTYQHHHHNTDNMATSHPTDSLMPATDNARHRKLQHMESVSSNLYAMIDNPSISEEYLDPFNDPDRHQQLGGGDNTLIVNHQQMSTCQTVCACKWKGGKQTVECIDQLLSKCL